VTESIDLVDRVKEMRLSMGLTQEEFAAKLGVTFCTVNRWENRKSKPSRMAVKILKQMMEDLSTNA
jgi:putative transcriptional regulator